MQFPMKAVDKWLGMNQQLHSIQYTVYSVRLESALCAGSFMSTGCNRNYASAIYGSVQVKSCCE